MSSYGILKSAAGILKSAAGILKSAAGISIHAWKNSVKEIRHLHIAWICLAGEEGLVAGFCECGNELSGYSKKLRSINLYFTYI
jgi:hypothetical protein